MPGPEAVEVLAGLARPMAPGLRWTRPEQWHVTLRFLGEADPGEAAVALGGLDASPAVAGVGPATAVLGRGVLMVPVSGLGDLAAAVIRAAAEVGLPPEDRPFTGHITLARSKGPVPAGSVGAPVACSFPVDEVCLVRSRTLPEGAEYEVLDRFGLG